MAGSLDKKVDIGKFPLVFNTTHRARITVYWTPKKLTEKKKCLNLRSSSKALVQNPSPN